MHRLDLGLYSHPKKLSGNGVQTYVISKGEIPSTSKILPRGGSNPQCCIKQDSEPNTLPMSYSSPETKRVFGMTHGAFPGHCLAVLLWSCSPSLVSSLGCASFPQHARRLRSGRDSVRDSDLECWTGAGIAQLVVLGLAAKVSRVRYSSGDIFR